MKKPLAVEVWRVLKINVSGKTLSSDPTLKMVRGIARGFNRNLDPRAKRHGNYNI